MKMTRGKTFVPKGNPAKRPPKVSGRVANDVWPNPVRSAIMFRQADDRHPESRKAWRGPTQR